MQIGRRWKTRKIRGRLAVEIIDFCIREILKEKRISARELARRAMEKYGVTVTPHWISKRIKIFNHVNIEKYYTTIKGKHMAVYALRGLRKTRKCRICGGEIPWKGKNVCSEECEKELERIANFYIPLPEGLKYSLEEIKNLEEYKHGCISSV